MALCVGLVEAHLARHPRMVLNETAANYRFAGRAAGGAARAAEVLVFGDSQLKFALLPRVVEARAGRRAFNLAIVGGQPPASYFLLRRALDAGAHPSAILLDAKPNVLADDPRSNARNTPELLTAAEVARLALDARDPDFLVRQLLALAWPSYRARAEARRAVKDAFRPPRSTLAADAERLDRNWRVNAGAMVAAKNPHYGGDLDDRQRDAFLPNSWRCDPVNRLYLGRFLDLARSRAIPVYWLIPPIAPRVQLRREAAGLDGRFTDFVAHYASRYDNLTVVDARRAAYPTEVFIDPGHLDRDGAWAYSAAVAAVLRRGPGGHGRWVDLPAVGRVAPAVALEDLEQSRAAIAAEPRGVRR